MSEKQADKFPAKEQGKGSREPMRFMLTREDRVVMNKFWSLGFEFTGLALLFGYFGYRADLHYDTTPWLTITGIVVAMTGRIYLFIKDLGSLK